MTTPPSFAQPYLRTTKVIKFTYHEEAGGYGCTLPGDQSGEYVLASEARAAVEAVKQEAVEWLKSRMINETHQELAAALAAHLAVTPQAQLGEALIAWAADNGKWIMDGDDAAHVVVYCPLCDCDWVECWDTDDTDEIELNHK